MTEVAVDAPAALPTHDLLLAVAGRVDDDLLTWIRELAAVGEEFRAVELLTATLIAERVALPSRVRAALVEAGRTGRTEFDAEFALPPAREDEPGTAHRFDPTASGAGTDRITTALHGLLSRQVTGCRVWLTWRVTPAGTAPGPLPSAVVLVEIVGDDAASRAAGASADVLAYQFASTLEHAGAPASVEVFTVGTQLPDYHQTALRTAHLFASTAPVLDVDPAPPSSTAETARHAEVDLPGPVVAPEQLLAERSDPAERLFGPSTPLTSPRPTLAPLPPVAAPDAAPLLSATPIADADPIVGTSFTPASIPAPASAHARAPSPPLAPVAENTGDRPPRRRLHRVGLAATSADAAAPAAPDPLPGPLQAPRLDPMIDENDPLGLGDLSVPPVDEHTNVPDRRWTSHSGTAPTVGLFDSPSSTRPRDPGDQSVAGRRRPKPRNGESFPLRGPATGDQPVPEYPPDQPPPDDSTTEPAIDMAGLGLRPESLARLSDTDLALLTRLQAELGPRVGGGPRAVGNPDATPTNGIHGGAPRRRARPPDIAD